MNKKTIKSLLNKEWKDEAGKPGKLDKIWSRKGKGESKMAIENAASGGVVKNKILGKVMGVSKNSSKSKGGASAAAASIRGRRIREGVVMEGRRSKDSKFDKSMRVLEWLDADCGTKLTRHYEEGGGWRYKYDNDDDDDDDEDDYDDDGKKKRPYRLRHPLRLTVSSNMLDSDSSWEFYDSGNAQKDSEEEEEERSEDSFFDDEEEDDDDAVLAIRKWQEKEIQQKTQHHCLEEISLQEYVTSSDDDDNGKGNDKENDKNNSNGKKKKVSVCESYVDNNDDEDELVAALKAWTEEQKLLQQQQQQQQQEQQQHMAPLVEDKVSFIQQENVFPFINHRYYYQNHHLLHHKYHNTSSSNSGSVGGGGGGDQPLIPNQQNTTNTPAPFWWVEDVSSIREGPSSPPVVIKAKAGGGVHSSPFSSTAPFASSSLSSATSTTTSTAVRNKTPHHHSTTPSSRVVPSSLLSPFHHQHHTASSPRSPSFVCLTPTASPSAKSPRLDTTSHQKINKTLSCPASRWAAVAPEGSQDPNNALMFGFDSASFAAIGVSTSQDYAMRDVSSSNPHQTTSLNMSSSTRHTTKGRLKSPGDLLDPSLYISTMPQFDSSSTFQNINPKYYKDSDENDLDSSYNPAIRISSSTECLPDKDPRFVGVAGYNIKALRSAPPYSTGQRGTTAFNHGANQKNDGKNSVASPPAKLTGLTKIGGFFRKVGEKFSASQGNINDEKSSSSSNYLSPHSKQGIDHAVLQKQHSSPPFLPAPDLAATTNAPSQPKHQHLKQREENLHKPLLLSLSTSRGHPLQQQQQHHRSLQPVKSSPPVPSTSNDNKSSFLLPVTLSSHPSSSPSSSSSSTSPAASTATSSSPSSAHITTTTTTNNNNDNITSIHHHHSLHLHTHHHHTSTNYINTAKTPPSSSLLIEPTAPLATYSSSLSPSHPHPQSHLSRHQHPPLSQRHSTNSAAPPTSPSATPSPCVSSATATASSLGSAITGIGIGIGTGGATGLSASATIAPLSSGVGAIASNQHQQQQHQQHHKNNNRQTGSKLLIGHHSSFFSKSTEYALPKADSGGVNVSSGSSGNGSGKVNKSSRSSDNLLSSNTTNTDLLLSSPVRGGGNRANIKKSNAALTNRDLSTTSSYKDKNRTLDKILTCKNDDGYTATATTATVSSTPLDTIQAKWKSVIHSNSEKKRHVSYNEASSRVTIVKEQLSFSHSAPPTGSGVERQQQQKQQHHKQHHSLLASSSASKSTGKENKNKNDSEQQHNAGSHPLYNYHQTTPSSNLKETAMRKSNDSLDDRSTGSRIHQKGVENVVTPSSAFRSGGSGGGSGAGGTFAVAHAQGGGGFRKSPIFDPETKIHSDSVERDPQGKARNMMTSSNGSFDGDEKVVGSGDNVFVKHVSYFIKKAGSSAEKGGSLSSERSSSTSSDERSNLTVPTTHDQSITPSRRNSQGTCNHLFREQTPSGRKSPLPPVAKVKKSPSPVRAALFRNIANTCPTYSSSLDSSTAKYHQQHFPSHQGTTKSGKPMSSPTKQLHQQQQQNNSQPSIPSAFGHCASSSLQTSPKHHYYLTTSPQHSNFISPVKLTSPDISPPLAYKGRRKFSDTGLTPVPKRLLKDTHPRRGSLTDERTLVSAKSKLSRLRWQGRKSSADSGSVAALVKQIHNLWGDGEDECSFNPPNSFTVDDQVLYDKRRKKFPFSLSGKEKDGGGGNGGGGGGSGGSNNNSNNAGGGSSSSSCERSRMRHRISCGNHSGSDSSLVIAGNSYNNSQKSTHADKNGVTSASSSALSAPSLPLLSSLSSSASHLLSSQTQISTSAASSSSALTKGSRAGSTAQQGETNCQSEGKFNYGSNGDGRESSFNISTTTTTTTSGTISTPTPGFKREGGGGAGGSSGGRESHMTGGKEGGGISVSGVGSGGSGNNNNNTIASSGVNSHSSSVNTGASFVAGNNHPCCSHTSKNSKNCVHCGGSNISGSGSNSAGSARRGSDSGKNSSGGGGCVASEFVAPVAQAASRQLVATAVVGAADLVGRERCDALINIGKTGGGGGGPVGGNSHSHNITSSYSSYHPCTTCNSGSSVGNNSSGCDSCSVSTTHHPNLNVISSSTSTGQTRGGGVSSGGGGGGGGGSSSSGGAVVTGAAENNRTTSTNVSSISTSTSTTGKRTATVQFQPIVSWDDQSVNDKYSYYNSPAKRSVLKQGARRHSSFAGFSESCDSISSSTATDHLRLYGHQSHHYNQQQQHHSSSSTSSSFFSKVIGKSNLPKSKTSDNYKSILKQTDRSTTASASINQSNNTDNSLDIIATTSTSIRTGTDKKRAKSPSPKSKKGFDYNNSDGCTSSASNSCGAGSGSGKSSSDISSLSLCLKATRSLSPKSKKCKTDNLKLSSCGHYTRDSESSTTDLSTERELQTDSGNCSFDLPTKTVGVQATPRTIGKTSNTGTQTATSPLGITPEHDPGTSSPEGGGWLQRLAAKCMASVSGNRSISSGAGSGGTSGALGGGSGGGGGGGVGGSGGLPRAASVRAEWLLGNKRMGSNPSSPVANSSGGGGETSERFWVPQEVLARKRAQSLIPTVSKQESEEDLSSENATPAFIPHPRELAFTFPEKTSGSGGGSSGGEGQPSTPPSGYNPGRRRASMHDAIDLNKIDTRLYDKKLVRQASVTSIEEEAQGTVHICLEHNAETSILTVNLVRAHNLSARDHNGTANPYCKLTLLPDQRTSAQSRIHRKTLNPEFEEEFIFELTSEQSDIFALEVMFFEYDQFSKDECVGHVMIPLKSLDLRKPLDLWRPIQPYEKPKDQRDHGDVMFSLSYLPSAERLTVVIVKARNLRLQDDGKTELNPFIKVCILSGNKKIKKKKTSTAHACNSPTWNEALVFSVHKDNLKTLGLEVCAYHDNKLAIDECIGKVRLPIGSGRSQESLTEKCSQPGWYTLTN